MADKYRPGDIVVNCNWVAVARDVPMTVECVEERNGAEWLECVWFEFQNCFRALFPAADCHRLEKR
jgi:hypothetical protein